MKPKQIPKRTNKQIRSQIRRNSAQNFLRPKILLILSFLVAFIFLTLEFPFSTLLTQHEQLTSLNNEITQLNQQNSQIRAQLNSLKNPSEIQQLARKDFGLITPGQQEYAIIPPKTSQNLQSSQIPEPIKKIPQNLVTIQNNSSEISFSPTSFLKRILKNLEFWKN
jgi:cell division protein FtsB